MATLFSVGLALTPVRGHPMKSEIVGYCGHRLKFASLHLSPHSTEASRASAVQAPRLLVSLQREGATTVSQDGRTGEVKTDDIFMVNPARPFRIDSSEIVTHSVYLPLAPMRALLPQFDDLTACSIDARQGPGLMFRAVVDQLIAMAGSLDEQAADNIADMLPYALAAALTPLERGAGMVQSRVKLLHKQRIMRFVRENLADPELHIQKIAAACNLSTRYIYQLCADEQLPVMKWIWVERLERCYRELATPRLIGRSVGEIAYSWGFSNVAHFSRAFRRRYGISPRELRSNPRKETAQR